MGTLFRSEEMALCELFIQSEAAYACISELGELGLVQFRDMNEHISAFQRKFVNEIRRCDEMERKLRFLEKEITKDSIPVFDAGDNPPAPAPKELIDLEANLEKLEAELKEVNVNTEALKRNYLELTELKHVLRQTQHFFDEAMGGDPGSATADSDRLGLLGDELAAAAVAAGGVPTPARLGFIAGVCLRERIPTFERMLWRVCRGNVYVRHTTIDTPLEDPATGNQVFKNVFIIFFQGEQLKARVKKICDAFHATVYPCPESRDERRQMMSGIVTRIEDLTTVLGQTQEHRQRVLVATAGSLKVWFVKVGKVKAIYHTMNMLNLDVTKKCLIAECWCPLSEIDRIHYALRRGTEASGSSVPSILNRVTDKHMEPPTFYRTNKFTRGFQNIVDSYGVANYREVNPAPYTIITFPFLFAVMFGDFGHGAIMLLFALFICIREKNLRQYAAKNETFDIFFGGRYVILLMAIFSMYTGFIYNDFFSKSIKILPSGWYVDPQMKVTNADMKGASMMLEPANTTNYVGTPYPIGIDPMWAMAENNILFTDSLKMKLSVILGVAQMMFGLILSVCNHFYFGNRLGIICDFIPQVLFLSCVFLYMDILIIYKWIAYAPEDSGCAPSILIGVISMFLFMYPDVSQNPGGKAFCYEELQLAMKGPQTFFVILALLSAFWMLLAKPIILSQRKKLPPAVAESHWLSSGATPHGSQPPAGQADGDEVPIASQAADMGTTSEEHSTVGGSETGGGGEQEENTVELFIHQAIHTIEFCLGTISHTASYLRLWALSLAHKQLADVLWANILGMLGFQWLGRIQIAGGFALMILFAIWAGLTVAILVLMEGLSAFLHALRLHWIEFNSKFYQGQGYAFQPFSFNSLLSIPKD